MGVTQRLNVRLRPKTVLSEQIRELQGEAVDFASVAILNVTESVSLILTLILMLHDRVMGRYSCRKPCSERSSIRDDVCYHGIHLDQWKVCEQISLAIDKLTHLLRPS